MTKETKGLLREELAEIIGVNKSCSCSPLDRVVQYVEISVEQARKAFFDEGYQAGKDSAYYSDIETRNNLRDSISKKYKKEYENGINTLKSWLFFVSLSLFGAIVTFIIL